MLVAQKLSLRPKCISKLLYPLVLFTVCHIDTTDTFVQLENEVRILKTKNTEILSECNRFPFRVTGALALVLSVLLSLHRRQEKKSNSIQQVLTKQRNKH